MARRRTKDGRTGKPGRLVLSSVRRYSGSERKSAGPWESWRVCGVRVFVQVRQRRPEPERWNQDSAAEIAWVSWRLGENDHEYDGEKLETFKLFERAAHDPQGRLGKVWVFSQMSGQQILRGTSREEHFEAYRKRLEKDMEKVITSESSGESS